MREQILQSIESRILTTFPAGESYSRANISESNIPKSIKHFLLNALQRRSELEASELLKVRSEWFDADNLEYQKVLRQAVLTLGKASCFPSPEWPKAVRQAVEHVVDYLVSPIETLSRFVFASDSDSISSADLQRKVGYFVDYGYLTLGVDAFIERKKSQRINKDDFRSALSHLDHQFNAQNDTKAWVKLLEPLVQVVGMATPGIPVQMAAQFFIDKGKPSISKELELAARSKQASFVSPSSLAALLDSIALAAAPPKSAPAAAPAPPISPPPRPSGPAETVTTKATPAEAAQPDTPLPLWKKFQKAGNLPAESDSSAPEPLWKTYSRQNEEAKVLNQLQVDQAIPVSRPLPDPVGLVLGASINRKADFVRKLFNNDESAFDEVIRALAVAPDWSTASEIIAQRVFRPFKVDIYSPVAVEFTNAVESRYAGLQA
ncbi:hypothetical protein HQ496_09735 [bacterium]|nr:hypothetical protein [bacterium]